MKTLREVVGVSAIPPVSGPMPDGKAMGYPYFKCSTSIFNSCIKGRKKRQRWKAFMGENDFTTKLKDWSNNNKKKKFLLKDENSDSYIFVNRFM